ncbi:hypothetical protein M1506_00785 [Patescibacteria group bacterium]|nr:hypothetical protein [Patescibacteria group bacterium]
MRQKIKRSVVDTMRTGIGIVLPFLIVLYVFVAVLDGVGHIGEGIGIMNSWLSLLALLGFIFFIGLVAEKTSFPKFLSRISSKHPLILRIVEFIFEKKDSKTSMREVVFYISPSVRMRGVVMREFEDNEKTWCVVHFSAPPTPGSGLTLIEIEKSELEFTGRSFSDYAAYILSYGGGNKNGKAAPIDS